MVQKTQQHRAKVSRRGGHSTQWAAQFAVASELCKRGYEVSFTMGNSTPLADLMVVSPVQHEMFLVDVKGLNENNVWVVRRKTLRKQLFYIFALVPTGGSNRFVIMTQEQVHRILDDKLRRKLRRMSPGRRKAGKKRLRKLEGVGSRSKAVLLYEDKWQVLPK